jgi:hypothetical protein
MIEARYKNGVVYTCHEWDKFDLAAMPLNEGLDNLRVDPFTLHFIAHGKPLRHFMRNGLKVNVGAIASDKEGKVLPASKIYCYVLETSLWKIFVFSNGGISVLRDWDPTSVWFSAPVPLPDPALPNGGKAKKTK